MAIKLDHLQKLFFDQLKDAYSAETQLLEALPKMRDAATDPELARAFADHLKETQGHAKRITQICSTLDISPGGHMCKAMRGLIEEGADVLKDKDADEAVKDAALICAAQKVEHYEMALYGCLNAYAEMLGHTDAGQLLSQTLEEEHQADTRLTEIAEGWVNAAASES